MLSTALPVRRVLITSGLIFALPLVALAAPVRAANLTPAPVGNIRLPWPRANAILARVKPPNFPRRFFSVLQYGGAGNGRTDCTAAFRKAISACSAAGGGQVVVPPGMYRTGAIKLLSNVDLHIKKGATLDFSGNARNYPLEQCRNQGIDLMTFSPLIYAQNQNNIAVTGHGILNAARTARWNHEVGRNWGLLQKMARQGTPIKDRIFGMSRPLATTFIEPYHCTNVLIENITLEHSHWWQLHPTLCTNVTINHVSAEGTKAHSDGCDPDSCDDVIIENCFLGAGDDCIAIKSGRNADKFRSSRPCENLVIMNSRFSGPWGMIACGSEQTEGIKHVFGYNLRAIPWRKYRGVRYALYIKSNTMRGGYTRGVHLDRIRGVFSNAVVFATLNYGHKRDGHQPIFDDITLDHVTATSAPRVLDIIGLRDDDIRSIAVRNSTFEHIAHRNIVRNVKTLSIQNVTVNGQSTR